MLLLPPDVVDVLVGRGKFDFELTSSSFCFENPDEDTGSFLSGLVKVIEYEKSTGIMVNINTNKTKIEIQDLLFIL